ncbi:hypothetical protein [Methylobacterium platani]|uniref:Uncharacterized protein n=2 Tax=Methylobacterium platani TaxID=427683 RepID=A0A179SAU9_9HYPH|nr:hypothetical protein [Methylobacterium platani]KMO15157.1 hypothetical protein SQ03_17635 [Methylobacterium platani JCM 14648]OAS23291.1 hypothetical protein A5481_16595 [Methylobacterium platani]
MELSRSETAELVRQATRRIVGDRIPVHTWLQDTTTFDGEDAIKIVVMFPGDELAGIDGGAFIDIMVSIRQVLAQSGDTRSPLVSFARLEDESELNSARYRASA